jgi:RNA polymerase sigma factor (TIGR02999 family)
MTGVARIPQLVEEEAPKAANQLLPLVYEELRRLAASRMAQESSGHTLQPTALVHEAWLRLISGEDKGLFANRAHFFGAASEAMRRILIDRARAKSSHKRGGRWERTNLENIDVAADADAETLLLVDEAVKKLQAQDPRAAELVNLRFFGGLTLEDAGKVLGISERTARRTWAFARAWLFKELTVATNS